MLTSDKILSFLGDLGETCNACKKCPQGNKFFCKEERCILYPMRCWPLQQSAARERAIGDLMKNIKSES